MQLLGRAALLSTHNTLLVLEQEEREKREIRERPNHGEGMCAESGGRVRLWTTGASQLIRNSRCGSNVNSMTPPWLLLIVLSLWKAWSCFAESWNFSRSTLEKTYSTANEQFPQNLSHYLTFPVWNPPLQTPFAFQEFPDPVGTLKPMTYYPFGSLNYTHPLTESCWCVIADCLGRLL